MSCNKKDKNKKKSPVKYTPKSEKQPLVKNTNLNKFMKRESTERDNRIPVSRGEQ